jgi:ABC-type dipeptide/oligopeptide/nickel transport system ATPase subunit
MNLPSTWKPSTDHEVPSSDLLDTLEKDIRNKNETILFQNRYISAMEKNSKKYKQIIEILLQKQEKTSNNLEEVGRILAKKIKQSEEYCGQINQINKLKEEQTDRYNEDIYRLMEQIRIDDKLCRKNIQKIIGPE